MHKKAIFTTVAGVVVGVTVYYYGFGKGKPVSKPMDINKTAGNVKSGINTAAGKANTAVDNAAGKATIIADSVGKVGK